MNSGTGFFEEWGNALDQSARSLEAPEPPEFQFERQDWHLYQSPQTLPQKAGVSVRRLRRLALKELVDNALDACDACNVCGPDGPVVVGRLSDRIGFFVHDMGPGIDPARVGPVFSINRHLLSSKLLRLPTRGAMGNGLRVVVGAVVASGAGGFLEVWTRRQHLKLTPRDDNGMTDVEAIPVSFTIGTRIEIGFGPELPEDEDVLEWAQNAIALAQYGRRYSGKSSAYWYTAEDFFNLLRAAGNRPVRDLITNLDGCTGAKAGKIAGDYRSRPCGSMGRDEARDLLTKARALTKPVSAERLGFIGQDGCPWSHEAYAKVESTLSWGISDTATAPVVLEAWVNAEKGENAAAWVFVNRTPITGPIRAHQNGAKMRVIGCGLHVLAETSKADYAVFVNITTPYMPITTEGKEPDLRWLNDLLTKLIVKAARAAYKAIRSGRDGLIKDAAWAVMLDAYMKASAGNTLPALARQVMYAARGSILEATGRETFDDAYFTQRLLPDFMTENPELTQDWDVVFDARGHLVEPHTRTSVPLGTTEVRGYLGRKTSKRIDLEMGSVLYPTSGPRHRYGGILFVEKEGFLPLLAASRIGERFDLAIASTKGTSVVAIRSLLDRVQVDGPVPVYVLHDMDVSGRTIYGTLATDSRRYEFEHEIEVHDLGLRYEDVIEMDLESEPFDPGEKDIRKVVATLKRHGASDGEIRMLTVDHRRVELNAMTSDQFVDFVERRLQECEARKVIPDEETLGEAWRRCVVNQRIAEEVESIRADAERDADAAPVPSDLEEQVREMLKVDPTMAWDEAVTAVLESEDEDEAGP